MENTLCTGMPNGMSQAEAMSNGKELKFVQLANIELVLLHTCLQTVLHISNIKWCGLQKKLD